MRNFGVKIMCKKLEYLNGLTPEEIRFLAKVDSYPVDMDRVLKELEIENGAMDFSSIEERFPELIESRGSILGAVTVTGDDISIFYSDKSTENRKRFTLAHELAHCCLDAESLKKGHVEFRWDTKNASAKEWVANVFAGQLLIPEKRLREKYNELAVPTIDDMAREFGVSIHVMEARLKHLGLGFYAPQNYEDEAGEC